MPDPASAPNADASPQSAEDALVALLNKVASRAVATATPAPQPIVEPPPPDGPRRVTDLDTDEAEAEFNAAIASGDGKKALKLLKDKAINPGVGLITFAVENMGRQNVRRLEEQFGEKFTKRKPQFEALMRKRNVTYMDLADPDRADLLMKLTFADDPSYIEEEVNERLARAKAIADAEAARVAALPPPVAPITDFIKTDEPHVKLAERFMPKETDARNRILRKCARYGVPIDAALRQVAKLTDHPEELEMNDYGEIVWVEIGGSSRPPAPKQKGAA